MRKDGKSQISNLKSQVSDCPASRPRRFAARSLLLVISLVVLGTFAPCAARADDGASKPIALGVPQDISDGPEKWTSPEGLSSTIQVVLLLTVLSLAPAILLMTTCFVRVVVVLSMLRQALGTQSLPPNQVITSLAMFITLAIMGPSWKQVYEQSIVPYTNKQISMQDACTRGATPIRQFMTRRSSAPETPTTCSFSGSTRPANRSRQSTRMFPQQCYCPPTCSAS